MALLCIDADDTLWENHGHFLEALARFDEILVGRGHDPVAAAARLRSHEARRLAAHAAGDREASGYGSRPFARSLLATLEALEGTPLEGTLRAEILGLGEAIYHQEVRPFPRVRATLEVLAGRHRLWLVTKGAADEQRGKVERSGLLPFFERVEILAEKTAEDYTALRAAANDREAVPWMIGNSPRSDVLPARAAGFRTVHIPHRSLWEHERAPLDEAPDLTLRRFRDLVHHF